MKRTRLAALALTTPLALALVACGGSDSDTDPASGDDATSSAASDATTESAPSSASGSPSDDVPSPEPSSPDDSATDQAPATPADGALTAAAATGADAAGGTVFSVDRQDAGGWEVSVVTDDGTEYDVRVSADGSSAEGRPVEDRDDGDDATRDRDERLRLLDVAVDYRAAIEAAAGSGGSGELTGIELDEENGTATWEVTYGDDTAEEITVYVDAASGEVVRTERDD